MRSYVFEDVRLANEWHAIIEVRDVGDRFVVADFMAVSPLGVQCITGSDVAFAQCSALAEALDVRKHCERWLSDVMVDDVVPEVHAKHLRKIRARRAIARDLEGAPESFDAAIMGQTAELIRRGSIDRHPYRSGVLGEGTNSDSLDADWGDRC